MSKMVKRAYFKTFPRTNKFCSHVYCLNIRTGWRDNVWAQSDWVENPTCGERLVCRSSFQICISFPYVSNKNWYGSRRQWNHRIQNHQCVFYVCRLLTDNWIIGSHIIGLKSSIEWITFQTLSFKEQSVFGTPFQETLWSVTRRKGRHEVLRRKTNKIINNINVDFGLIRSMSRNAEFYKSIKNRKRRL